MSRISTHRSPLRRSRSTDGPTRRFLLLSVSLLLLGLAPEAPAGETAPRQYLAPSVYRQGPTLFLQGAADRHTSEIGEGFSAISSASGEHVVLLRGSSDRAQEVIVLSATGSELLHRVFPRGRDVLLSQGGLVTLARSAHAGGRAHEVRFFSTRGELVASAVEPGLVIEDFSFLPGGQLVTLNRGPGAQEVTVIVYDEQGELQRRHGLPRGANDVSLPLVHLSRDGERLALVRWRDLLSGRVDLELLDREGNVVARHNLPRIDQLASSSDSRLIAAAGPNTLLLLDAADGAIRWQSDLSLGTLALEGLFFDLATGRLLVVTGTPAQDEGKRRVRVHTARLADGDSRTLELGEQSSQEDFLVIGVTGGAAGVREIVLPGGAFALPGSQAGAP